MNNSPVDGWRLNHTVGLAEPTALQNLVHFYENKTITYLRKNNNPGHPSDEAIQRMGRLATD
jgi:hypothetical protein